MTDLELGSTVVFGAFGTEPRGKLPTWSDLQASEPGRCVVITDATMTALRVSSQEVLLRDQQGLQALLPDTGTLYLDISGLPHHVWAPLLRAALAKQVATRVVYVEPESYRAHPTPASPTMFDLSVDFGGVSPIPGFVQLAGPDDDAKTLFVPFLGFEGSRPRHLALQIDPTPKVIPVVGVPGFRLEYPSFTVACNRTLIDEYRAHAEIRYARASCPFEAYEVLEQIMTDYEDHYLYLAPVGTKPHSLGALKFALDHPTVCEVMYDHPRRKTGRTRGVGLVHIYSLN